MPHRLNPKENFPSEKAFFRRSNKMRNKYDENFEKETHFDKDKLIRLNNSTMASFFTLHSLNQIEGKKRTEQNTKKKHFQFIFKI